MRYILEHNCATEISHLTIRVTNKLNGSRCAWHLICGHARVIHKMQKNLIWFTPALGYVGHEVHPSQPKVHLSQPKVHKMIGASLATQDT